MGLAPAPLHPRLDDTHLSALILSLLSGVTPLFSFESSRVVLSYRPYRIHDVGAPICSTLVGHYTEAHTQSWIVFM